MVTPHNAKQQGHRSRGVAVVSLPKQRHTHRRASGRATQFNAGNNLDDPNVSGIPNPGYDPIPVILTVCYRLPTLPIRVEIRSIGTTIDVRVVSFGVARPEPTNATRGATLGTEHEVKKLGDTAVLNKLCPRRHRPRRHPAVTPPSGPCPRFGCTFRRITVSSEACLGI